MPKSQLKENETVNLKLLHSQFKENRSSTQNNQDTYDRLSINKVSKPKKYFKTTMMIIPRTKNSTEQITTSSLKFSHLSNSLSLIPFTYDDNDHEHDNLFTNNPNNNKDNPNQKAFSKNISSILEAHSMGNTIQSQVQVGKKTNKSSFANEKPKVSSSTTDLVKESIPLEQKQRGKSNSTHNLHMINKDNKPLKCVMSFETSSIKYCSEKPQSKFKSQNEQKESLLFSIYSEENEKDDHCKSGGKKGCSGHQRVVLDKDIRDNRQLIIENHHGKLLKKNEKLVINAAGLDKGLRKSRDGVSHFGFRQ